MTYLRRPAAVLVMLSLIALGACGSRSANPYENPGSDLEKRDDVGNPIDGYYTTEQKQGNTIWEIFNTGDDDVKLEVNKYLWAGALEVLDFLPVQTVDPFSGVITTGYGTPPGGGRSYRATVYIRDPALEARSLNVALQTRGGAPVNAGTARAVEDAILARARQLRIADGKL